jgi:hypothetical protein
LLTLLVLGIIHIIKFTILSIRAVQWRKTAGSGDKIKFLSTEGWRYGILCERNYGNDVVAVTVVQAKTGIRSTGHEHLNNLYPCSYREWRKKV